jgi:hypothetical protein
MPFVYLWGHCSCVWQHRGHCGWTCHSMSMLLWVVMPYGFVIRYQSFRGHPPPPHVVRTEARWQQWPKQVCHISRVLLCVCLISITLLRKPLGPCIHVYDNCAYCAEYESRFVHDMNPVIAELDLPQCKVIYDVFITLHWNDSRLVGGHRNKFLWKNRETVLVLNEMLRAL